MSINTSKPTSASIAKPHIRPTTTSAFASAALARLPPPGKGASSSSKPVMIRPAERALNLPKTRAVFESHPYNPVKRPGIPKTVPLHGRTPGKASRQRVQQREAFDARVRERMEKEDRERREEERLREEEEEEEYRRRRKQTVIWAKPVPSIYRAG